MRALRCRASCALVLSLAVAVPAAAQQLPALPYEARIMVRIVPQGDAQHRGVAYLRHLDADSLHFRFEETSEVWAVAWSNVRDLKVSEGIRYRPFAAHAKIFAGLTAFGALFGYAGWHSCRDPEESDNVGCILAMGRLSSTIEGGALVGASIALVHSVTNLKGEQWRDVPKPGAVRVSVRRAGGGLGVGLSIAF